MATSLLVLLVGASYAVVHGVAAAACGSTVTISGPSRGQLILTPAAAKVQIGDCLAFTNSTSAAVNLSITRAGTAVYSTTLSRGATTATGRSYRPKNVGSGTISVTSHVLVIKMTGSGTVSVTAAPTRSPSPSDSPTPHGHQSSKPSHKPTKSSHPHKSSPKSHSPKPHATGFKLPPLPPIPTTGRSALPKGSSPVVAPGLPTIAPPVTTTSSTPVAAVVAGPLETAEDTSRGLPIAVAVLVLLGLVSGYGRVLVATPRAVDNRSDGQHRA